MGKKRIKNMKREQQKAAFWKMSHIKSKMSGRSPRAVSVDRSINARNVYTGHDTKGKDKWMKHPNRVDMKGVDTAVKRQQFNARKSKESMKQKKHEISKINKNIRKTEGKKKQIEQRKPLTQEEKDAYTNAMKYPNKEEGFLTKKQQYSREPDKFMTYREYQRKQKELGEKIKQANMDHSFAYGNMGYVDTESINREKRLSTESSELERKAKAYSKKHPGWIDGIGDKERLAEVRKQIREDIEKSKERSEITDKKTDKYNTELREAYKKRDEKKEELRKIEKEHIQRKAFIKETRYLSPENLKKVEKLTPQERSDLTRDVEYWYNHREGDISLTPSEKTEIDRINAKYDVDSGLGAYVAITGKYPRGPRHTSSTYKRTPRADSPVTTELDNTVKLTKLKSSINSTETKHQKISDLQSDLQRHKENERNLSDSEKNNKYWKKEVDDTEHELFIKERQYKKYLDNRKKSINQLKQDPNIRITKQPIEGEADRSNVILEYKGKYVTSKKTIPDVDNDALKDLNI